MKGIMSWVRLLRWQCPHRLIGAYEDARARLKHDLPQTLESHVPFDPCVEFVCGLPNAVERVSITAMQAGLAATPSDYKLLGCCCT
jgi:hypothetical protein